MVVTKKADTALEQAVSSVIGADQKLSGKGIVVHVREQVVILEGNLGSLAELNRAEKLTLGVDGIKTVDSSPIIIADRRPDPTRDRAILHEAEQALARHPGLRETQVKVAVDEGKATLSGTVEILKQKMEAHRIISEIRGITAILNLIETTATESPANEGPDGIG